MPQHHINTPKNDEVLSDKDKTALSFDDILRDHHDNIARFFLDPSLPKEPIITELLKQYNIDPKNLGYFFQQGIDSTVFFNDISDGEYERHLQFFKDYQIALKKYLVASVHSTKDKTVLGQQMLFKLDQAYSSFNKVKNDVFQDVVYYREIYAEYPGLDKKYSQKSADIRQYESSCIKLYGDLVKQTIYDTLREQLKIASSFYDIRKKFVSNPVDQNNSNQQSPAIIDYFRENNTSPTKLIQQLMLDQDNKSIYDAKTFFKNQLLNHFNLEEKDIANHILLNKILVDQQLMDEFNTAIVGNPEKLKSLLYAQNIINEGPDPSLQTDIKQQLLAFKNDLKNKSYAGNDEVLEHVLMLHKININISKPQNVENILQKQIEDFLQTKTKEIYAVVQKNIFTDKQNKNYFKDTVKKSIIISVEEYLAKHSLQQKCLKYGFREDGLTKINEAKNSPNQELLDDAIKFAINGKLYLPGKETEQKFINGINATLYQKSQSIKDMDIRILPGDKLFDHEKIDCFFCIDIGEYETSDTLDTDTFKEALKDCLVLYEFDRNNSIRQNIILESAGKTIKASLVLPIQLTASRNQETQQNKNYNIQDIGGVLIVMNPQSNGRLINNFSESSNPAKINDNQKIIDQYLKGIFIDGYNNSYGSLKKIIYQVYQTFQKSNYVKNRFKSYDFDHKELHYLVNNSADNDGNKYHHELIWPVRAYFYEEDWPSDSFDLDILKGGKIIYDYTLQCHLIKKQK